MRTAELYDFLPDKQIKMAEVTQGRADCLWNDTFYLTMPVGQEFIRHFVGSCDSESLTGKQSWCQPGLSSSEGSPGRKTPFKCAGVWAGWQASVHRLVPWHWFLAVKASPQACS